MEGCLIVYSALCVLTMSFSLAFDCNQILSDTEIKFLNWEKLEECIIEIGRNAVDKKSSERIWQLVKNANDGIENISPLVYKNMGNLVTGIPLEDLRNITINVVEIVKAFGSVQKGFTDEQMNLIAQKVRSEWPNKIPQTYSEYDLKSMGQIVCYLNRSDIAAIHAVALRFAVEWIGNLENCPADRMQAFAKLAVQHDAFGPPASWSTLDVSIMGNIIKGLTPSEIDSISKDKLQFNKHFRVHKNRLNSTATMSENVWRRRNKADNSSNKGEPNEESNTMSN
ncbi:uncharacterized protein LOC129909234 [Episyrphus balteatus]|uniref:uncharacterized protein LOC129909234 n=1 Tax=Episyrphus balteatus TaxID=286459 RepID=UPI00248500E2|nr:uncharacterized protein LOC129909234 [Episyrphus balteatus]